MYKQNGANFSLAFFKELFEKVMDDDIKEILKKRQEAMSRFCRLCNAADEEKS